MPLLETAAGPLHYAHAGAGKTGGLPMVFVHGALCDHDNWRHQMAHFSQQRAVVAPDLHGHGRSGQTPGRVNVECFAEDVIGLCRSLGWERVVLVGHSMGCRVLLQTWRVAPQLVAGLVCVDGAYLSSGLLGDISEERRLELAGQARARAAGLYAGVEPAVRIRHGFPQMFYDPAFDAERDALIERAVALPAFVPRELMPAFAGWDMLNMEPVLATLKVPLLAFASTWMNSAHQRVSLQEGISSPWLDALQTLVPQAQISRHHGRGHFLMLERPEAVNAAIDAFLQSQRL